MYIADITEMYNHDMMKYPSTSTATASEHNCTCIGCRERDVRDSQIYTYSNNPRYEADRSSTSPPNPHSLRPQTNDNQTNRRPDGQIQNDPNRQRYVARKYPPFGTNQNNRTPYRQRQNNSRHEHTVHLLHESRLPNIVQPSQPGQREIEPDWIHPSECECQCGDINCKECEERRLLDPEETTVLSSYPHREYRNQPMNMARSNNFSSRTTGHVSVNDEMNINNNVQIDYVSYSENPSSSFSLRACPDGDSYSSSMKSSITSKHSCSNTDTLKCTCKKPPVCTCRKGEVQSSCSGDDRKRFSTPVEKLYASEIDSSRLSVPSISDSDPNLSTNPYNRRTSIDQSGKRL